MKKDKKPFFKLAWSIIFCFMALFLFFQFAKAEKIDFLAKCDSVSCFSKPASGVISSDGKFVLVVDSSSSPYLKKYDYANGSFTASNKIPLNISNPNSSVLQVLLSKNDKQAFVFKAPEQNSKASIVSINLDNNSAKSLTFYSSNGNDDIGALGIIAADGSIILAGNTSTQAPKGLVVNVSDDVVIKTLTLDDSINGIQVAPDLKKAIITYKSVLSESLSVYNIETSEINTQTVPDSLFFSVDAFLPVNAFDLNSKKHLLGSLGGYHVLHLLDLKNDKLTIDILDNNAVGLSLPAISPDGTFAIVASVSNNKNQAGYKVYKINLSSMKTEKTTSFTDGNNVIDIKVTPDQRKAYLLVSNASVSTLKVLDTNDLSLVSDYRVSGKKSERTTVNPILFDPSGRYAVKPDALTVSNSSTSSTTGGVCSPPACTAPPTGCTYINIPIDSMGCQTGCGTLQCGSSTSSTTGGCVLCSHIAIICSAGQTLAPQTCTECAHCVNNTSNNAVCGNGLVEAGEDCETANGITFAASCTNCILTCRQGTKRCSTNQNCTPAPSNSNAPGTGSNCGCYCNFVQVRKDEESTE